MTDPVRPGPARYGHLAIIAVAVACQATGVLILVQAIAIDDATLAQQGVRAGSDHAGSSPAGVRPDGPFTVHPPLN